MDINQLLGVETSVPVSGSGKWSWDCDSCGVDSLPDVALINTSCHFFDQDWCETLRSEILVDAKEVDLHKIFLFLVHPDNILLKCLITCHMSDLM